MLKAAAALVILVGVYLAIFKPPWFALWFGLTACNTDAYGILFYLAGGIHRYERYMDLILLACAVISVIHFFAAKNYSRPALVLMAAALAYTVTSVSGCFFYTFQHGLTGLLDAIIPYRLATDGNLILLICVAYCREYDIKKIFLVFAGLQIALAAAVLYLPLFGVNRLAPIVRDFTRLDPSRVAVFSNFYKTLISKKTFSRSAQFINANLTGFYGGAGAFIFGEALFERKRSALSRISCFIMLVLSAFAWFNSGMRGVILGILAGCVLMTFFKKDISRGLANLLTAAAAAALSAALFSRPAGLTAGYFINAIEGRSWQSRIDLARDCLGYLSDNWMFGDCYHSLYDVFGIRPHWLPLHITTIYGFFAGLTNTVLVFVFPVWYCIKRKRIPLFTPVMFLICWGSAVSNNYTALALFWFAFAAAFAAAEEYPQGPAKPVPLEKRLPRLRRELFGARPKGARG